MQTDLDRGIVEVKLNQNLVSDAQVRAALKEIGLSAREPAAAFAQSTPMFSAKPRSEAPSLKNSSVAAGAEEPPAMKGTAEQSAAALQKADIRVLSHGKPVNLEEAAVSDKITLYEFAADW